MLLYVTKNGQTFGPHKVVELAAFVAAGNFSPDDYCWQEGWAEWRAISSVLASSIDPALPSLESGS